MKALITVSLTCILPALAEESAPPVDSPSKAYTVVIVPADDTPHPPHYVIQSKVTGKSLGACPDDFRFQSTPSKVIWSRDSRWVAIETRMTRHGGRAEVWRLNGRKATLLKATYPQEAGNFYFSPSRWLNDTDLEFDVIGIDRRAPDPENSVKFYKLVMRVNSQESTLDVLTIGKAAYGHF